MKVEVRGVNLHHGYNPLKRGIVLCTAEINLPDVGVGISDVILCWGAERGYGVLPPMARGGAHRAVHWKNDSEVARSIVAEVKAVYHRMGGKMPDAKTEPAKPTPDMPVSEMGLSRGLERTLGLAS